MSLSLDAPFSLYTIAAAYIIAWYPHFVKYHLINSTVGFDNVKPRDTEAATLLKRGMKPELVNQVEKMTGAHRNGNEIFPLWVAAVLAGNQAGIDQRTLNIASLAFIGSRLIYNYIYINQKTEAVAGLRTIVYVINVAIPIYLITISANNLRVY